MLNWEEIAARIENPHMCLQNEVQDLKEFCDKFPYSQVFPLLYLKVLSKGNHVYFEDELEKYAHKITDRVQLYNLLYLEEVRTSPILEVEINQEQSQSEIHLEENKPFEVIKDEKEVLISELETEIHETEIEEEEINETPQTELESEIDELDKEILASSVNASFVLEEFEETLTHLELPEFDMSISEDIENTETESEAVEYSVQSEGSTAEKTFLEWLTKSSEIHLLEEEDNVETLYEVSFIEFEKPKREFFSPVKKAKESLNEETLPVSETLAKIYQMQGNISKAIYVYQQLSLIIPEKKTYFASQIKSLKKKLN